MNQTRINGILVKGAEVVKPCSCKECKCSKSEESTSEWFSRKQREAITKTNATMDEAAIDGLWETGSKTFEVVGENEESDARQNKKLVSVSEVTEGIDSDGKTPVFGVVATFKNVEPTDTIESIADIDVSTKEGKYLLMALSKITTESQRNKTPIEVLDQLTELKNLVYHYENSKD